MTDTVTLLVTDDGTTRRERYEPRPDGRFDHFEDERDDTGAWRPVGHRVVDDVTTA